MEYESNSSKRGKRKVIKIRIPVINLSFSMHYQRIEEIITKTIILFLIAFQSIKSNVWNQSKVSPK